MQKCKICFREAFAVAPGSCCAGTCDKALLFFLDDEEQRNIEVSIDMYEIKPALARVSEPWMSYKTSLWIGSWRGARACHEGALWYIDDVRRKRNRKSRVVYSAGRLQIHSEVLVKGTWAGGDVGTWLPARIYVESTRDLSQCTI